MLLEEDKLKEDRLDDVDLKIESINTNVSLDLRMSVSDVDEMKESCSLKRCESSTTVLVECKYIGSSITRFFLFKF